MGQPLTTKAIRRIQQDIENIMKDDIKEQGIFYNVNESDISTGTALIAAGTTGKITTGSWIHFAFVRTSGVFKTFFNGIQDISVANTTAYNGTYLFIGAWRYSSYDNSLNGYLDDVRITKGYARYTSNFTPPTEFANK